MLRMTVAAEEYLLIGDNVKVVFLGGTGNHLRVLVDAPKEVSIVRSKLIEKNIENKALLEQMPKYYRQVEHPEKFVKKPRRAVKKADAQKQDS